ncbi:GNAT family N-acetyltransferase [Clostridium sp. 'White wine YQ']|uniref:GNAT family N-acetyltransferase n=1 Tax=Clostridium sp. 'White wine YQ' TaxID=3027474 RepID=UPI0023663542|nr:GNAT family N-acetyltransferase [Clostridium sp. 'White wine YQ']MDD7795152.1 GNAT family N-acetyltransferase [Clostridium sp. 'White wine YQ']
MFKLIKANGLTKEELQAIKELEEECNSYEELNMKLNWDMLESRAKNQVNDFLYYEDDKLIGFLGMYGFGSNPKEIEATGMVHPSYRRKGIFKELMFEGKEHCKKGNTERILLITERRVDSGIGFVEAIGSKYSFSEYRMRLNESKIPSFESRGVSLKKADIKHKKELLELDREFFGLPEIEEEEGTREDNEHRTTYIAELEGKVIGKIGVTMDGEDGYIFGFGIKHEYRRKGYGRIVLSLILEKLLKNNVNSIILEVASENDKALGLYKSCGFKESTIYDYYKLDV